MFSPMSLFANFAQNSQHSFDEAADASWPSDPPQMPLTVQQVAPEDAEDDTWTWLDSFTANSLGEI